MNRYVAHDNHISLFHGMKETLLPYRHVYYKADEVIEFIKRCVYWLDFSRRGMEQKYLKIENEQYDKLITELEQIVKEATNGSMDNSND